MNDRSLEILAVLRRKSDALLESGPSVITCDEIADELERLGRIEKKHQGCLENHQRLAAENARWMEAWRELEADIEGFESFAVGDEVKAFVCMMLWPALDRHKPTTDLEAPDPCKQEGS